MLREGKTRGVSSSRKLVCETCQYPQCAGEACAGKGTISTTPPPHNAYREGKWYCKDCRTECILFCSVCKLGQGIEAFPKKMRDTSHDDTTRICSHCSSQACRSFYCSCCKQQKADNAFAKDMKRARFNDRTRACSDCQAQRYIALL